MGSSDQSPARAAGAVGDRSARRREVPLGRVLKRLVFFVAAAVGLYFVWPQLVQFFDAVPGLRSIEWSWFALMGLLEAASFAAYWGVMRVTLHEGRWSVLALTQLASNAFSRVVPGGAASGGSVGYHMLVHAGLPKGAAVTGLTATSLLSAAVLMALPALTVPAILGGAPVAPSLLRALVVGVVVSVLIVTVGGVLLFTERPLRWIGRVVQRVLERLRRRVREVEASAPDALALRLVEERDLIKRALGARWWQAISCAAANWLLDFGALLAALAAVGATARPSLVLLAYVVAVLLGMIPITPGGLGFVEVGLAATLGVAGVGAAEATTAVLAYRLISFWLPIPAGLVAALVFRHRFGNARAHVPAIDEASS
jgi:uncharacterized protein (TIRG00374 family)